MNEQTATNRSGDELAAVSGGSTTVTRGHLKQIESGASNLSPHTGSSDTLQERLIGSFAAMPVALHVRIPLAGFRIHALAVLQPGTIVSSAWPASEDLPVTAGGIRLAWAEFAIADHKRSVRVTRIA